MANVYNTPGVYVEEISKFPPSVAEVATAIPAFIGYTEKQPKADNGGNYSITAIRISSLLEYESTFGFGPDITVEIVKDKDNKDVPSVKNKEFVLYDSLRLFYDNGGGVCYIVSIGDYNTTSKSMDDFKNGIDALDNVDEVTLLLFPDAATCLNEIGLKTVQQKALTHCQSLGDRFAILDVVCQDTIQADATTFRTNVGNNALDYGAAYYPYLQTVYTKSFDFESVLNKMGEDIAKYAPDESDENYDSWQNKDAAYDLKIKALIPTIAGYDDAVKQLNAEVNTIPPSGAIAGVISSVDNRLGVWKAPANVSIASVSKLAKIISHSEQEDLNVDSKAGKSINAIRAFSGEGIKVWGARTLDGNSNEWRYIPVRRLFNFIEESVKKSTAWAVFSPNDANTWIKIKSQIENFLYNLWRQGALAGSNPESAYFVNVGLNITMTPEDIQEGKMIIEIGIAAVRPAEFIILRFSHKIQE